MNRNVLIALFIVAFLIVAVVVALLVIQGQDQPQVQEPQPGEGTAEAGPDEGTQDDIPPTATPALIEVVVSLQTVPRGFRMEESILAYDLRKAADVPSNVITDMEDAINLFARTDIFQGETLTIDALVEDPTQVGIEEFGPSSLIPEGFIAMSVPVRDEFAAVAYAVDEGDFVDILITLNLFRIDQEFQSYLENDAIFFVDSDVVTTGTLGDAPDSTSDATPTPDPDNPNQESSFFEVSDFGRIEELANGDLALVRPSEFQRPIRVALVLQNAKVIQVGQYTLPPSLLEQLPTPTPEVAEGEETPTPGPAVAPTQTPNPPASLVVALAPQQQLLLRHALDTGALVDFALRGTNDNQLYSVENIDFGFLLALFDIEIPPDFDYTLFIPVDEEIDLGDLIPATLTPTPQPTSPPDS